MALYSERNALDFFVSSSNAPMIAGTLINQYSDITNAGQLAVVNENGTSLDEVSVATCRKCRIVQRLGTTLKYSDWLLPNKVISATLAGQKDATYRIDYIGSNGTAGSLDLISSNDYRVSVVLSKVFENLQDKPYEMTVRYISGTLAANSATGQYLVGKEITKNFNQNLSDWKEKPFLVDLVIDTTIVVANDFVTACQVINGSEYIYHTTNANYDVNTPLAVGDFIRFAYVGTTPGDNVNIAVTNGIYRVVELVSATVTKLDRPYQGPTETISGNDNQGTEVIPSATGLLANFGIKFQTLPQTNFKVGDINYQVYDFSVLISGFVSTTVTNAATSKKGIGEHEEVAELELQSQMKGGPKWRTGIPSPTFRADTVDGTDYEYLNIVHYDDNYVGVSGVNPKSLKELLIACPVNVLDSLVTYLEALPGVTFVPLAFPVPA